MSFSFDNPDDPPSGRSAGSDAWPSNDDGFSWEGESFGGAEEGSKSGDDFGAELGDGFHFEGGGATSAAPQGSPPMHLLGASAGLSLLGVVLAFVFQQSWWALALGWLLAGPLAILLLGQFVQVDNRQRSRPIYTGGPATRHYATILGVLALACVVAVAVLAAGKAARAW